MSLDPGALADSLARLRDQDAGSGGLNEGLHAVTAACVDLFGVTGSAIMLADDDHAARYVAASDDVARALEVAERETGQGPCTEAFATNQLVSSSDLRAEPRWSALALRLRSTSVRAVLGVPVRIGALPIGTLDVYRDDPGEWDESECSALMRYGEVVESIVAAALAAHRAQALAQQLQYALDYRVVIERGVGYLMSRDGVDAATAFDRLRGAARSSRMKIGDVADGLLTSGRLAGPAPDAAT